MDCRTQLASLAIEELDKGDFLMATKILTTGIRLEPNNHELYFERSICHHKLGDYQASLDDANTAIRLNSSDYNIHYQRALALIGLSKGNEAVTSFKKAIELRAKQDDSKLSDIFKLLRDATNELKTARGRHTAAIQNHQARSGESVPVPNNQVGLLHQNQQGQIASTSNDPVDSTTDRPLLQHHHHQHHHHQPSTSANHQTMTSTMHESLMKVNGNNNLVATNRNNQAVTNSGQIIMNSTGTNNRVSSSASHVNNKQMTTINVSPNISSINAIDASNMASNAEQQAKAAAQFEWNIRRSERIFLHHTGEPGTSGPQFGILTRHNEPLPPGAILHQQQSGIKRPHDSSEPALPIQREPDVDVDDSYNPSLGMLNNNNSSSDQKRVLLTPSSSMPATSQGPSTSTSKDDSYSSKYKRLRRDRERARRGTSKLCTIKASDLEELQRSSKSDSSGKRSMRVIAPIDGWLYSGQLSVDDNLTSNGVPQYVVKLDGDATRSNYLFSAEAILRDVIKEVRVKTVSELRKGARICCYWSRQYKCLSTGVVTSRTFEATKSLVSVKYDNGDLSALPLEDLRLLPPDYPKYMSNCDPLLLARNGGGVHNSSNVTSNLSNSSSSTIINSNGSSKIAIECNQTASPDPRPNDMNNTTTTKIDVSRVEAKPDVNLAEKSRATVENTRTMSSPGVEVAAHHRVEYPEDKSDQLDGQRAVDDDDDDDDDAATIPPTDETIDFITSESTPKPQDENQHEYLDKDECAERDAMTKDSITLTAETQLNNSINNNTNTSRASSEENNFGIEYCPWMFDGPPRRIRRHGRTYRDNYSAIRRGNEVLRIGDSAELMPRDESILPFIAKIDELWATGRGEMRVRVRWYYRLVETEGEPFELKDGENALFETDHEDDNDVQSIYRATKILSWTDYSKNSLGHVNKNTDNTPKIFYLAGYYDPVRRIKHLRSDVKEAQ